MIAVWSVSTLLFKEIFRKKDFYVALILILVILFYAGELQFYNVKNAVRYLREIGLALIFLFSVILTVPLAARQFPSEVENRTFPILLAKPITRFQFLFGKFLGSALAGVACFTFFYITFLSLTLPRSDETSLLMAFQVFYLFALNLVVVAAMASAFSYFMTLSANVAVSIIVYLLINTYGAGLKQASEGVFFLSRYLAQIIYYLLPHFEFFDLRQRYIHSWEPLGLGLMLFLTAYAVVYAALFLFAGWLKLRKFTA